MKNNLNKLLCLLLILTISNFGFAQKKSKSFQGTIIFNVTYTGEGITPMQKASMPSEITMHYRDNYSRTEYLTPMATIAYLTSMDSLTTIFLLDMGTQKIACTVSSKEETKKSLSEMLPSKIKYFDSTKVIAGYSCKKAIVTSYYKNKDAATGDGLDSSRSVVYYTEELSIPNSNWNTQFKEVKGVLLEFSDERNDMTERYTAKEVKKKKLPDLLFKIPSDYQVMTKEEFKNLMGGGGGEEE